MKLTPEQVEALDVGTVVGRLADAKNLLFIMDSWMCTRGKVDELKREADLRADCKPDKRPDFKKRTAGGRCTSIDAVVG